MKNKILLGFLLLSASLQAASSEPVVILYPSKTDFFIRKGICNTALGKLAINAGLFATIHNYELLHKIAKSYAPTGYKTTLGITLISSVLLTKALCKYAQRGDIISRYNKADATYTALKENPVVAKALALNPGMNLRQTITTVENATTMIEKSLSISWENELAKQLPSVEKDSRAAVINYLEQAHTTIKTKIKILNESQKNIDFEDKCREIFIYHLIPFFHTAIIFTIGASIIDLSDTTFRATINTKSALTTLLAPTATWVTIALLCCFIMDKKRSIPLEDRASVDYTYRYYIPKLQTEEKHLRESINCLRLTK